MEQATFEAYCQLILQESGIKLSTDKVTLLTNRIQKRIRALGCGTEQNYLAIIKADQSQTEIVHLIDAISTNLTYFFREERHFEFLREQLAANFQNKRLRIWCTASSSGEEPYSLAMTVREAIRGSNLDAKILATDICTTVLETAIAGRYTQQHVEKIPQAMKHKYFAIDQRAGETNYTVLPNLRELLIFKRLNLAKFPYPLKGNMDFIFCRNVMIYFDNELRTKLIAEFFRLLRPGGYLCVGHSESLTSIKHSFEKIDSAIYRRP